MPTTEKQIRANRKNAKKSTGPKSPKGKLKSSQNAVKHGLYAKNIVINSPRLDEDPHEYRQFLDNMLDDLKPATVFERELVLKIVNCLWRSRRVSRAESAQINRQLDWVDNDSVWEACVRNVPENDDEAAYKQQIKQALDRAAANLAGTESIPSGSFSAHLLRYEMRLDRQLSRAYDLLRKLQSHRYKTGEITEPSAPAPRSRVPKNEQTNPFEKAENQTPPDSELTLSQNDIPAQPACFKADASASASVGQEPSRPALRRTCPELRRTRLLPSGPAEDSSPPANMPGTATDDIIIPDHSLTDEEAGRILGQICAKHNAIVLMDEKTQTKK